MSEFSTHEWTDILGTGAVRKKVITTGKGKDYIPQYRQKVTIRYEGKNIKTNEIFDKCTEKTVRIGDQNLIPGLELGVKMMEEGETALIQLEPRFAYGDKGPGGTGLPTKPGDGPTLEYNVTLLKVGAEQKEAADMTHQDRMEEAKERKLQGNEHYKFGNLEKAVRCYKNTLALFPEGYSFGIEKEKTIDDKKKEEDKVKSLLIDAGNNLAHCYQKLGKIVESKEACVGVLSVNRDNIKALLRHGELSVNENDFVEAKACLTRAKGIADELEGGVFKKLVDAQLVRLRQRKKKYKKQQKSMYGGKFSTLSNKENKINATNEKIPSEKNNEKKVEHIKQDTQQSYFISLKWLILCVVVLLLSVFIFWYVKMKKNKSWRQKMHMWEHYQ